MIVPAVIPASFEHLGESLKKVSFASRVQIDVVDGTFVANVSWPYRPAGEAIEAAGLISGFEVEVDLMVSSPMEAARDWLAAGAKALVFHIESLTDPEEALALRAEKGFELGWSLENDTPLERLFPLIDSADFVQLMGIAEIGAQGQPFDDRVLERISALRALYPELTVSIDGGVTKDTIAKMRTSGADRFAVGSAILRAPDPKQAYDELLKIVSA